MKLKKEKTRYGFSGKAKAFISIGAFITLAGIIALFAVHQINQFALAEERIVTEQIRQVEAANASARTNEGGGTNTDETSRPPAPEAPAPQGSTTNRPRTTGTASFTNRFGTSTTICAQSGCNNFIAPSGDTHNCTSHSNRCAECRKLIDGDALFCIPCIENALSGTN